MLVIARIPDLSAPEVRTDGTEPQALACPAPPSPPRRERYERRARPWPTWPVAALAVVVVVTWVLATWNDHARLRRQREEARVACEPAAMGPVSPAAEQSGAVVR